MSVFFHFPMVKLYVLRNHMFSLEKHHPPNPVVGCWPREPCFFLRRPHKCNNQTLTVRHLNHLDVRFTPRNHQFCIRFYVFNTCFFLILLYLHSKSKENEDANSERALPEQRCHNRRPTDFVKPTHKLGSTKLSVCEPPKTENFLIFQVNVQLVL